MSRLHVVTPVKDSLVTTLRTIDSVVSSVTSFAFDYTVYNDFSTAETTAHLESLAAVGHWTLVNLQELTSHPSPNYRLVLEIAQGRAMADDAHLLIVESDVVVGRETLQRLYDYAATLGAPGMIAAVTTDPDGRINFPYLYARRFAPGVVATRKRLSFCCTLLTRPYLGAFAFADLDPSKSWFDVPVSRKSLALGFTNYLVTALPVTHAPHSSRPWKHLKYTRPLQYWWEKLTQQRDRI